jgi:hypothetical protein
MIGPVRVTHAMLVLACTSACGARSPAPPAMSNETSATDPPTVTSHADVKALGHVRVRVIGRYEQIDVRKRDPRVGQPLFQGHAALRLDDGSMVTLEPPSEPSAVRSPDEIARFEGTRVVATGLLYPLGASSEPHVARMITPALWPVETIEPVDQSDSR